MGRIFRVEPAAYFMLAAWMLCVPLRWWTAAVTAAAVHELFHVLMIRCTGGRIRSVKIGCMGAVMDVDAMEDGREAICALSGPLGSFFLLLFANSFPELAICAGVQGVFNLLPVYPLDGGRALRYLLPEGIFRAVECFIAMIMLGTGIWLCWGAGTGPIGLLPAVLVGIVWYRRKIPCKESKIPVQ